jgi:hypothetical protein
MQWLRVREIRHIITRARCCAAVNIDSTTYYCCKQQNCISVGGGGSWVAYSKPSWQELGLLMHSTRTALTSVGAGGL